MIERNKLIEDLKSFSLIEGEEFILSSGQKSNIYIDVKQISLLGASMYNLAKMLYQTANMFGSYDTVAGVPFGGLHLASIVAMFRPPTNVILIRKEIKDHGTQKLIEFPEIKSKNIILFEDVITTGQSALKAAKYLNDASFNVRGIVAVVDRRPIKAPVLGDYDFRALVDFEELI